MSNERTVFSGSFRSLASYAFLGLCVVAAVWVVLSHRHELREALVQQSWVAVLASCLFALGAVLAFFRSWLAAVADTGVHLGGRVGLRIYSVGQVGKYLPGAVWPVVTQAELGRRAGTSPFRMASGALLALAVSIAVGLVVGCALLPFADEGMGSRFWWAPVAALGIGALLLPPLLNGAIHRVVSLFGRPTPAPFTSRGVLTSAIWCTFGNLLFGMHILFLGAAFGLDDVKGFIVALCAYCLASSIGVLVVLAPAGAGAREAIMVAVLAPVLPISEALAVALLSRVVIVAIDLLLALSQARGPHQGAATRRSQMA